MTALFVVWLSWAVLVLGFALWPRRKPALPRAPATPIREALPVVLVHGFAGFDEVGVGGIRHAYFRGVRERLSGAGVDVRSVKLPPIASLRERAAELAHQVHAMRGGKLHVVAHSMGGLDARLGLARLGLADRVATLITLGTPHRGTPLAGIVPRLGRPFAGTLLPGTQLRALLRGLEDLSPERVRRLEEELADAAGVRYASFVLEPQRGARGVCAPLVPSYLWLERRHGASDGLVPTSSQPHGIVLGTLDTDHWGAIGWGAFDASSFYERLGVHLAADESLESFDHKH